MWKRTESRRGFLINGQIDQEERGRWEWGGTAPCCSKRGKSLGVGPWWKRKTVLSGDFGFTSSVCPLRNTLRSEKKTLVSLANESHIRHEIPLFCKLSHSFSASCIMFSTLTSTKVVHVTVHADGTREHFFHVCCYARILLLTYSIFVVDSLVIKTRCLCSNRWSNCITARRYLLKNKNIHSRESALSCKVFIQFYFRINGSTPHLCSLLPTPNQIWSRSQSQSLQKLWDRSLIAGEVFPILISEKARLWNSRSEGRVGGGGGCLPATCWSEEFMFVSSWWSGLKSFDLRF